MCLVTKVIRFGWVIRIAALLHITAGEINCSGIRSHLLKASGFGGY